MTDDPGIKRCIFRRGVKYPERIQDSTKVSTSKMFCGSASGQDLPPYVEYKSEHLWDLWTQEGRGELVTIGASRVGLMPLHLQTGFRQFLCLKLDGFKEKVVIIGDNLASHFSKSVISLTMVDNISFVCLPKNATHLCQPFDVAFYRVLQIKWRQVLDKWKSSSSKKS